MGETSLSFKFPADNNALLLEFQLQLYSEWSFTLSCREIV